jgi:hypothetical protein
VKQGGHENYCEDQERHACDLEAKRNLRDC